VYGASQWLNKVLKPGCIASTVYRSVDTLWKSKIIGRATKVDAQFQHKSSPTDCIWVMEHHTENADRLQVFVNTCLQRTLSICWPDRITDKESWKKTGQEPHVKKKWWQHHQTGATVDTTRPQRKRVTREYLEKRSGERNVDRGDKYSWRKMELQDRAGWNQVN